MTATVTLFGSAFALYLGIVYLFSFSMQDTSARHAINSAIVIMDALIVARFITGRWRRDPDSRPRRDSDPGPTRAYRVAALSVLLAFGLLQADYLFARYRYASGGVAGSLELIKAYVLGCQLLYVVIDAMAITRPSAAALPRLFRVHWREALPLSVVLIPLVHYLANNRTMFSFASGLGYLGCFLLLPLLAFLLVQALQRLLDVPAVASPLVAGLALTHYSLPMVSAALSRPIDALFWVQCSIALTIVTVLVTIWRVNKQLTARALALYTAFSITASFVQAGPAGRGSGGEPAFGASLSDYVGGNLSLNAVLSGPAKRRPDVYLLIYDSLAPSPVMARYGIDDRADTQYLDARGFKSYRDSYSLFGSSRQSMSSTLDMRPIARASVGGHTTAAKFFRQHGYTTHLIVNSYMLQGAVATAVDDTFPRFHDRWDLAGLFRGLAGGQFKPDLVFRDTDREQWLSAKRAVLRSPTGPPRMLYAHSMLPGHSEQTGACRSNEIALYANRLEKAREEMRADIAAILNTHRDAVIIVAGDHGPYLAGDCSYLTGYRATDLTAVELADRYAVKLAIRWPEAVSARIDRIKILQDVFFGVSAYVLDDDRVWSYRPDTETFGIRTIPDAAISDGVIRIGRDRGRPLLN